MENHICPDRTDIQITYDYTWTNLYLNKIASDIKYLLNAGDSVSIKLADSVNCDELIITCSKGSIPLIKNEEGIWEGTIPTDWNTQEVFSVIMVINGSKGLLYQGLLNQYDSFQSVEDEGYYINSISQVGNKINAVSKKFDDELTDKSINAPQTKVIKAYVDNETSRAKESESQIINEIEQLEEGIDEALNTLNDKVDNNFETLNISINDEINNREKLAGHSIKISQAKEHIIDIDLINANGESISHQEINLDDEHIIDSVYLDYTNKKLIFTFKDGHTIDCDVSDMIDDLNTKIDNETSRAKESESQIQSNLDDETTRAKDVENDINSKIPTEASATNQLADKDFVNSSIATATATFRGVVDSIAELKSLTGDLNDYAIVKVIDSVTGLVKQYDKYKYTSTISAETGNWMYEYTLNNSSFTDAQWKAINSGITELLVEKILTNEKNISTHINNKSNPHEVSKAQIGLGNVDNTSDVNKPISTATQKALDLKQDKLTAGDNISLDDNKVSVVDTTNIELQELTEEQIEALNSGITADLVNQIVEDNKRINWIINCIGSWNVSNDTINMNFLVKVDDDSLIIDNSIAEVENDSLIEIVSSLTNI